MCVYVCMCVCVCECMSVCVCLCTYVYVWETWYCIHCTLQRVVHVPSIPRIHQYNIHRSIPLMLSGEVIQHKYEEMHVICTIVYNSMRLG